MARSITKKNFKLIEATLYKEYKIIWDLVHLPPPPSPLNHSIQANHTHTWAFDVNNNCIMLPRNWRTYTLYKGKSQGLSLSCSPLCLTGVHSCSKESVNTIKCHSFGESKHLHVTHEAWNDHTKPTKRIMGASQSYTAWRCGYYGMAAMTAKWEHDVVDIISWLIVHFKLLGTGQKCIIILTDYYNYID